MKLLVAGISVTIVLVAVVGITSQIASSESFPSVTVDIPGQGSVLGNYDTTLWTNQTIMQFRGIPYAESPNGDRRFKAPVARLPWRQILDATKYGRRCPQIDTLAQQPSEGVQLDLEDCLNLCVYTKDLDAQRPVMFYIYGGGFYNGSSEDHPPRHLLEKDIVLVVPQYRIGALGWATMRTPDMPGNVPALDLLLALQWVQDHISAFGGDPRNVTVFGQSAGAAMSGTLLLSPKTTDGLFKRMIIQSGSILASWAINKRPRDQVEKICKALACGACRSDAQLYQCLKEAPVLQLLEVTKSESFSPIVGDIHGVLPQVPSELVKVYKKSIPLMTGFTKHDGSFTLATYYDALKQVYGNLSYVSVRQFAGGLMDMVNDTTLLSNNLLTKLLFTPQILNAYDHKLALPSYFDLTNIIFMKSPVIALSSQLFKLRTADVYLYSFDYDGANTRFGYEMGNEHYPFNGGVHHSNDNIYLFSTHTLNETDTEVAKIMVELWTSFAINGEPAVSQGPRILPLEHENGPYFSINREVTVKNDILDELTATIDDPDNKKLDREDIEF